MALSVLAYNLTRVMNIVRPKPLMVRSQPETEPILASHRLPRRAFLDGQDPNRT
jgi:hypothetical protein